ncbi:MAG TPA: GAF domain-containing protein [Actinoplanes sp.]|jgi:hypothetical protein
MDDPPARGPLVSSLTALAASPEYLATINAQLETIVRLAAERVAAVDFASITGLRGKSHVTVAVSDELIRAVDDAQHSESAGPCVEALHTGRAVGVPDIGAVMRWPGFHEEAPRLGLDSSLSLPLHTGSGDPVAVLNLYARDRVAMAPLIAAIGAVRGVVVVGPGPLTDEGGRELVAAYAEALSVRDRIRRAIEVIMRENRCAADDAYVSLCIRAADGGTDLAVAAASFLPSEPA